MSKSRVQPLKQPLQQRSRMTVQAILEAAIHVFDEFGYAAGTTSRIASRAGVSIGSLYQYYPNKDAILTALAEQHLAEGLALSVRLLETLRTTSQPLAPTLDEIVDHMLRLHEHNPGLHRLLYEEGLLPAALRQAARQAEQFLIAEVARCLSLRPDVAIADRQMQAYFVVHAIEHFTHRLVIDQPPPEFQKRGKNELVTMLLRYLQT
ncbi:TetR/AcrR family transcriptional regulator [Undibacterium sp. CY18W]|uniref:TetR/AcrR family transcriptional regulator n=1 Tax=Undibacterium hunanense TaxID=2762292 RepID=A0ABR6ZXJ8_9BURK|nr:TetR/AcrR family transcriptional regulator [Undibacterium hunanense]MBC3920575.1 TetR/AcrR family transcriptional regulator [Undibacterium hunanense]